MYVFIRARPISAMTLWLGGGNILLKTTMKSQSNIQYNICTQTYRGIIPVASKDEVNRSLVHSLYHLMDDQIWFLACISSSVMVLDYFVWIVKYTVVP